MKSSSRVKIGSLWTFKHASPKLIVKVFEINKIYVEERHGKKTVKIGHTEVVYGLRSSANGHICQTLRGFLENYERRSNA
jgi:hypothetical protein